MTDVISVSKPQPVTKLTRKPITRARTSKYQKVIDVANKLKPGEMFTVPTPEGGTHVAGFWNAILKGIKGYGELATTKRPR